MNSDQFGGRRPGPTPPPPAAGGGADRAASELHHLSAAYALDALDPDERQAFEAHVHECDICAADVAAARQTMARLAASTAAPAPERLEGNVMAAIARTRQLSPLVPESRSQSPAEADRQHEEADAHDELAAVRQRRARRGGSSSSGSNRWGLLAGVAAAAIALVVAVGVLLPGDDRGDQLAALLEAPDAVVTDLPALDDGGAPLAGGSLRLVWSADLDRVAVIGNDVDVPDPGSVYQLWLLVDDGVVSAGVFEPAADGSVRNVLDVADVAAGGFGVTIEPDGGSEQPTLPIVFAAEI